MSPEVSAVEVLDELTAMVAEQAKTIAVLRVQLKQVTTNSVMPAYAPPRGADDARTDARADA